MAAGNGGSYDKCRRRWDLADAEHLKYKFMQVCNSLSYARQSRLGQRSCMQLLMFQGGQQHVDGVLNCRHLWLAPHQLTDSDAFCMHMRV